MAQRPTDVYNPTATVAPETGMPSADLFKAQATPESFGGQIGGALEKAGSTIEDLGQKTFEFAMQKQGILNEATISAGDLNVSTRAGAIVGNVKSQNGFAKIQAADAAVPQIQQLIEDEVNKHSGNLMVQNGLRVQLSRSMGMVLREIGGERGTGINEARNTSIDNNLKFNIDQLSDPSVASDPTRAGYYSGMVKHGVIDTVSQKMGYGSVIHLSLTDGKVSFDDSPQGREAENAYNVLYEDSMGQAAFNRAKAIASNPNHPDPTGAWDMVQEEYKRGLIPAKAMGAISEMLLPKIRGAQVKQNIETALSEYGLSDTSPSDGLSGTSPSVGSVPDNMKQFISKDISIEQQQAAVGILQHETSGFDTNARRGNHLGLGQFDAETWHAATGQIIAPQDIGTSRDPRLNPELSIKAIQANLQKSSQYLRSFLGRSPTAGEMVLAHQQGTAGAKFLLQMDPNTPVSSLSPIVQKSLAANGVTSGSTVGQAVSKIEEFYLGKTNTSTSAYDNKTIYNLRNNEDAIGQKAFDLSWNQSHDYQEADEARNGAIARIRQMVGGQEDLVKNAADDIYAAINGKYTNGRGLTDQAQLEAISQVAPQWDFLQKNNYFAAMTMVNKMIRANALSKVKGVGYDFWTQYQAVQHGPLDHVSLLSEIGPTKDDQLTGTGYKILTQNEERGKTVDGAAFNQQEYKFLNDTIRSTMVHDKDYPGGKDADGQGYFTNYLLALFPRIEGAVAAGQQERKPLSQIAHEIFDPKSKNYIANDISVHDRSMAKKIADMGTAAMEQSSQPSSFNFDSLKDMNWMETQATLKDAIKKDPKLLGPAMQYWDTRFKTSSEQRPEVPVVQ